jgi:hypothetical protein
MNKINIVDQDSIYNIKYLNIEEIFYFDFEYCIYEYYIWLQIFLLKGKLSKRKTF